MKPIPSRFGLVLFDCDGVLVDSEIISNRILAEHLTAAGMPITEEQVVERFLGGSFDAVIAAAEAAIGRALPPDFEPAYRRDSFAAFTRELQPVAGVAEVVDGLQAAGVPTCVASSGPHAKIRHTLGATGLLARFDDARIFSAADVGRGKPWPDLFLHAAEQMGVAPADCAVIEDSPAGVHAALAAGMAVYGLTQTTPRARRAREGVTTFGSMEELPGLLR